MYLIDLILACEIAKSKSSTVSCEKGREREKERET